MKNIVSYSFLLLLIFLVNLQAQEKERLNLTLNEALKLAKKQNYELQIAREDVNKIQADLNSSLAVFLPQITFNKTFVRTNDPLNVFGLKLKQESVTQMDFNPVLLNNPDIKNNYNTKLELFQPVINLDGFFGRAAAADGLAAMKQKQKRTEYYISFMVKVNYFKTDLMEKSYKVVNQAEETAIANRKLIKDYFDEGLITKADYLMAEVFVNKVKSQKADIYAKFHDASDELKHLLALDDVRLVKVSDNLLSPIAVELNDNAENTVNSRSDVKSYEYRKNSLGNMHTMSWTKLLPRLNLFAGYEYNDDEIFGTDADNWMVGVNLRWEIFNGFKNISSIQKSKAEANMAEVDFQKAVSNGKNEIRSAIRELNTAELNVRLAKSGEEQLKESLRIIKDRFKKGLEKTADLLIAETEYSGARLNSLQALFFYNVSLYKLELMLEKSLIK